MNAVPNLFQCRERIYRDLVSRATPSANAEWLARILASWTVGEGALPDHLGLGPDAFTAMLNTCFPGYRSGGLASSGRRADFSRMLEREELENLLRRYFVGDPGEREWIIGLLVAGCLGEDHLWQDLGFWTRAELSAFLERNFPALAARNVKDMKWKKFLYKQLCEAEGIYVCRSPTCEACADFLKCYGSEE